MKKIATFFATLLLLMTTMFANAAEYSVYFDNTAKWSKVNVYGWNGIDFGAWPGKTVTTKTDEGYYKVTVTANADPSTLGAKIIFNNGSGTQTGDLAWVTNAIYTKNGNSGKIYGGGEIEMKEFKIYFDNSTAKWSKINIYGWNGVNFGAWPGSQITTKTEDGYYVVTVKETVSPAGSSIIFNSGSAQTSDLVWVDNAIYNEKGNTGKTYPPTTEPEEPEQPAVPEILYVRGDDMGWDPGAKMTLDGTVYSWTGTLTNGKGFKFVNRASGWDNDRTDYSAEKSVVANTEYTLNSAAGSANLSNTTWGGATGNVTITIDFATATPKMKIVVNSSVEPEEPEQPEIPEILYVRGDDMTWDPGAKMTLDGTVYSWTGTLTKGNGFKFVNRASGWDDSRTDYSAEKSVVADTEYTLNSAAGSANLGNTTWNGENGVYTITIDFATATPKMKIVSATFEENIVCEQNYYLRPGELWNTDNAWFAAYFFNQNTGAYTWVEGEMMEYTEAELAAGAEPTVLFYLAKENVPTRAADPVYTHVIFTRMNPASRTLSWDNVWNQTGDLTYTEPTNPDNKMMFVITAMGTPSTGEWQEVDDSIATGIENVVANGVVYTNNTVVADGAIEVYNINGVIVARGNNSVDLHNLNNGIYIVRNGEQVRKVVR